MKTLLVYDSVFGNTEKVAMAMGAVLTDTDQVVKIGVVTLEQIKKSELLIVGSPTRGFRPTEAITKFIQDLPADCLQGKFAAAFDTRIPPESIVSKFFRKIVVIGGYADKAISNLMEKKGANLLASAGFFVQASEGPLVEGECERAANWIKDLVISLKGA